ncbi:hypothetical protein ACU40M_10550 [Staphylococcus arlettae]
MSRYKLDMSKYTIDDRPRPITNEMFNDLIKRCDQYKAERDTLIDDIAILRANNDRLKHENKRLKGLTENLVAHRTMWEDLKEWRMDELLEHKDNYQLIDLGVVMDKMEKEHLYKGGE